MQRDTQKRASEWNDWILIYSTYTDYPHNGKENVKVTGQLTGHQILSGPQHDMGCLQEIILRAEWEENIVFGEGTKYWLETAFVGRKKKVFTVSWRHHSFHLKNPLSRSSLSFQYLRERKESWNVTCLSFVEVLSSFCWVAWQNTVFTYWRLVYNVP